MNPRKIELENFLSYAKESFDFTKFDSATVIGKNGAGKSSFCTDAITWALFGQGTRDSASSNKNYVKQGAEECHVTFEFELNDNIYKIYRGFNAITKKSSLSFCAVEEYGEVPVATGNIKETQECIEKTLRLNYLTFTSSSMILQNNTNMFCEGMTDMERKKALLNILGVNVWDNYAKKVKDEIKELSQKKTFAEENVKKFNETISLESEYVKQRENYKTLLSNQKTNIQKIKDNMTVLSQKLSDMSAIKQKIDLMEKQKNDYQNIFNNNIANITANESKKQEAEKQIEKYEDNIQKAKKIIEIKDQILQAEEVTAKLQEYINTEEQKKNQYNIFYSEWNQAKSKSQQWEKHHTNEINSLNVMMGEYKKQSAVLSQIPCAKETSAKCPLLTLAYEAQNKLTEAENKMVQLNSENNPFVAEIENKEKLMNENLYSEENIKNAKKQMNDWKPFYDLIPSLKIADERIADFQRIIESYKQEITNKSKENEEIVKKNENIQKEISSLANQINSENSSLQNYEETKREYSNSETVLQNAENDEKNYIQQIAILDTQLTQIEGAKKEMSLAENERKEILNQLYYLGILNDACSKKAGVPSFIIENALPALEAETNKILDEIIDGRLQMQFVTQIETGKNTVQEVFKILIKDYTDNGIGFSRDFSTYSGAEKFIVALALRIATSRFLVSRTSASVQLFVLDEGVSCADAENKEAIMTAIKNTSSYFKKILFITHNQELEDVFDAKILVTKDSESSHLSLETA